MRAAWSLAGVLVISVAAVTAGAADRFVATTGADGANNCLTSTAPCGTISQAIDQAATDDTINVAGGFYKDNVVLSSPTTLTLLGGWDGQFTTRDPRATPTVVRSGVVDDVPIIPGSPTLPNKDRILAVNVAQAGDTIILVLDGFTLTRGYATTQPPLPDPTHPNDHWQDGGGLEATARGGSVSLTVRNSVISNNRAATSGGGVGLHAFNGGMLDAAFENVVIVGNKATDGGGGLSLSAVTHVAGSPANALHLAMTNCVVANGKASGAVRADLGGDVIFGGGAMWVQAYDDPSAVLDVRLVNSTLTRNSSNVVGGVNLDIENAASATITLTNTVLAGNRDRGGFGDLLMQAASPLTVSADHSDLGLRVTRDGTFDDLGGNVSVKPGLTRSFELLPSSPLIDAGTCTGAPSTDFEADPRPSGAGCDIGADEFQF